MEAVRNLHTFHEFPENTAIQYANRRKLWAGTDGRSRHRLWARGRLVFGQADARARTASSGAWHPVDLRNVGVGGGCREPVRGIRHQERRAGRREDILFLTGIACRYRFGIRRMRWRRDDCCSGSNCDREGESTGKYEASRGERICRHFSRLLVIVDVLGILRTLTAIYRHSSCSLGMCLSPIRKSWGAYRVPALCRHSDYGLELIVERGTGLGPSACCSSDNPMH